jgi:integrase
VLLGIDAGLRRGEIVGLKWPDVLFSRGVLVVRHNVVRGKLDVPKGRSEDEVALTTRLLAVLKAYRHEGTRIADGGGGVAAVAAHLRHKSLAIASRYIDRSGASSRAINALES